MRISRSAMQKTAFSVILLLLFFSTGLFADDIINHTALSGGSFLPWWGWSLLLFVFCFMLGIIAILAGVGGGILYVPIVSAIFPFHLDFVRGSGLLVALAGAISAAPRLLKSGMASLRLALPMALVSSIGSLIGARGGLIFPTHMVEFAFGVVILFVVALMLLLQRADDPLVTTPNPLAHKMGMTGTYTDGVAGDRVQWSVRYLIPGFFLFFVIGVVSGMFGLGGGWANVPALNLLLGVPLKVSVATSILIIAINGSAASWVYLNEGAVLPVIAIPSVVGMMLGTRIGAKMLSQTKTGAIRWLVIGFLVMAGLKSLLASGRMTG